MPSIAGRTSTTKLALGIIVGCLVLGILETLQQHAGNALREASLPFSTVLLNTFLPWLLLLPLVPGVLFLANRFPLDQGRGLRYLPLHVGATLLLVLTHQWLAAASYRLLSTPPHTISFVLLWTKLVTFRFAVDALVYWAIIGVVHAARATHTAREQEQAALRLEASLAEARLTALREQLQPHFLFNSLNAVSTLALRGDREAVTQALATLSELLRFALETQRTQEVPLAEELAFLDRYLELMQLRFGDRLKVSREVEDGALDAAVPAMVTQPLVENAVRHGIARVPGPGRLAIRVTRDGGAVRIEVRDSGPGFTSGGVRDGVGLANTRARLASLHGDAAWLETGDAPEGGARVTISLPYRPLPIPTPVPDLARA